MKGKFITFEGPEGGGKTTQLLLLAKKFKERNIPVAVTREPGGTEISEKIRNILLDASNLNLSFRAELLLIVASRAQNTAEIIIPALEKGVHVLCDRYSDSTLAYQSFGRGFSLADTKEMCLFATDGIQPDLTFLFDIEPQEGLIRAKISAQDKNADGNHDRMEQQGIDFHRKVRNGFLNLAESEPERFIVLDGRKPIEDLHREVLQTVEKTIPGFKK